MRPFFCLTSPQLVVILCECVCAQVCWIRSPLLKTGLIQDSLTTKLTTFKRKSMPSECPFRAFPLFMSMDFQGAAVQNEGEAEIFQRKGTEPSFVPNICVLAIKGWLFSGVWMDWSLHVYCHANHRAFYTPRLVLKISLLQNVPNVCAQMLSVWSERNTCVCWPTDAGWCRTSGHQAEHGKHMQTCLDTFAVVTSGCLAREGEAKIRNFSVMKTSVSKTVSLFGTWLALSWDLFFLILVKLLSRMLRGFFEGRILWRLFRICRPRLVPRASPPHPKQFLTHLTPMQFIVVHRRVYDVYGGCMRKMIRTKYFGAQQIRFKNLFLYVLAELNIHKTRCKFGTKSVSICLNPINRCCTQSIPRT